MQVEMSERATAVANAVPVVVVAGVVALFSGVATAVIIGAYVLGGIVTVFIVEGKSGGEDPWVVATGWYAGPLMTLFG